MQKGITQIGKKASSTKALCKKATHKQEDCKKLKIAKKKAKNKKSNHHGYRCIFIEDIFKCAKQEQEQ